MTRGLRAKRACPRVYSLFSCFYNFYYLIFRLDEALKTLEAERQDKDLLQKEIEALHTQIGSLETKCDELNLSRSDLTRDLQSLKVDYTDQIRDYARQVDDNVSIKHNLEQVIAHLREEVQLYF